MNRLSTIVILVSVLTVVLVIVHSRQEMQKVRLQLATVSAQAEIAQELAVLPPEQYLVLREDTMSAIEIMYRRLNRLEAKLISHAAD